MPKKFEYQKDYVHSGIRVNLNLTDEYAIAQIVDKIEKVKSKLKGIGLDIPEIGPQMSEAQEVLNQINCFLKKMTTINLTESDLFTEIVDEEKDSDAF